MMKKAISIIMVCIVIFTMQTALSAEDVVDTGLGLSEEEKTSYKETGFDFDAYEAYLAENGIAIVDGNIQIETAEQFSAILTYYWDYLLSYDYTTPGHKYDYWKRLTYRMVADYIVVMNIAFISPDVLQDLVNMDLISSPFVFFDDWSPMEIIAERLLIMSKTNSKNEFISNVPIIFDADIRGCVKHLENKLRAFIMSSSKTSLSVFFEFSSFLSGEDLVSYPSQYPLSLSELDPSARCTFDVIFFQVYFVMLSAQNQCGNIFTHMNTNYQDKDGRYLAETYIQQYLDVFPSKLVE